MRFLEKIDEEKINEMAWMVVGYQLSHKPYILKELTKQDKNSNLMQRDNCFIDGNTGVALMQIMFKQF